MSQTRRQFLVQASSALGAGVAVLGIGSSGEASSLSGGTLIHTLRVRNGVTERFTLNLRANQRFYVVFNGKRKTVRLRRRKHYKLRSNVWKTDYTLSSGDIATTRFDYRHRNNRMRFDGDITGTIKVYRL